MLQWAKRGRQGQRRGSDWGNCPCRVTTALRTFPCRKARRCNGRHAEVERRALAMAFGVAGATKEEAERGSKDRSLAVTLLSLSLSPPLSSSLSKTALSPRPSASACHARAAPALPHPAAESGSLALLPCIVVLWLPWPFRGPSRRRPPGGWSRCARAGEKERRGQREATLCDGRIACLRKWTEATKARPGSPSFSSPEKCPARCCCVSCLQLARSAVSRSAQGRRQQL